MLDAGSRGFINPQDKIGINNRIHKFFLSLYVFFNYDLIRKKYIIYD